MNDNGRRLGEIIQQRRIAAEFTLRRLSAVAGVSASYLGRVEKGERFPSAHVLRKIAGPLGIDEEELFTLAGYISAQPCSMFETSAYGRLDPAVALVLSREPVDVQRTVLSIFSLMKYITRGIS